MRQVLQSSLCMHYFMSSSQQGSLGGRDYCPHCTHEETEARRASEARLSVTPDHDCLHSDDWANAKLLATIYFCSHLEVSDQLV